MLYNEKTLITDRIPYIVYTLQVYTIILICIYYIIGEMVVRGISERQLECTTCIEVHQRRHRHRRTVQLHPFTAVDYTYIYIYVLYGYIQFMRNPLT